MDIATIKSWFTKGKKPTATQFAEVFDSYIHKDEGISISNVKNLQATLSGKADKVSKATLNDIATLNSNGNLKDSDHKIGGDSLSSAGTTYSIPMNEAGTETALCYAKVSDTSMIYFLQSGTIVYSDEECTVQYDTISQFGSGSYTLMESQKHIYPNGDPASWLEMTNKYVATENAVIEALSNKQDTLIAGTNITIEDNVISATGGGDIPQSVMNLIYAGL